MNFNFEINGKRIDAHFKITNFAQFTSEIKLMLAIGQASDLKQGEEQDNIYKSYILRVFNKGLADYQKININQLENHIGNLLETGLITNSLSRLDLTDEAYKRLYALSGRVAENHSHDKSKEITPRDNVIDINTYRHKTYTLPGERTADEFYSGQKVILFYEGSLHFASIKLAKAYDSNLTLGAAREISNEEKEYHLNQIDKRKAEIKFNQEARFGPDHTILRHKVCLEPIFREVIENPSPGLLHIMFKPGHPGLITDMHHNYIIPLDSWNRLLIDDGFLESWLNSGSEESLRNSSSLREVIFAHSNKGNPELDESIGQNVN